MRDYLLEQKIERKEKNVDYTKKELLKSAIVTGLGAGVVVAGACGTIHFGQAYIDALKSDEALTYGLYTLNQWKLTGLSLSIMGTIIGGSVSYYFGKNIFELGTMYKEEKNDLKELKLKKENLEKR